MCASYGLGGDGRIALLPDGLEPTSEAESPAALREWSERWGGKAAITRDQKRGLNLNPIVHEGYGERTIELAWWWLHVGGKPARFSAFNSRDDALLRSWRGPFQRRALLPADWYSEGKKTWRLPSGEPFAIAAITAPRVADDGSESLSYSMVTRHGVGEASTVLSSRGESRMPLVLPAEFYDEWLDPQRPGDAELVDLVQRGSDEISRAMTVI